MQTVGSYRIEGELGRGGMGTVYRAFHDGLGRPAAVKVLSLTELKPEDQLDRRFMREARLMSLVTHPNVVKLLDFGQDGDRLFIAMELLDGITLQQVLAANLPLIPRRMRSIALGLVRGVAALHDAQIVHRDLKPSNIMLLRDGSLKIMDLGLARSPSTTILTHAGNVSGTVSFMPPEAGTRRHFTTSYDIYQLGMVLHLVFTGLPAFPQPPLWYLVHRQPIPEPTVLEMPHDLGVIAGIIRKCLRPDPDDRYSSGSALLAALEEAIESPFSREIARPRPRPGEKSTTPLPVGQRRTEIGSTRDLVSGSRPAIRQEPPALRLTLIVCVTLGVGLTPFLARPGDSSHPGLAAVPRPAERAGPTEWLDLSGTLPIHDTSSLGRLEDARPVLEADPHLAAFHGEIRRALDDPDQSYSANNHQARLEYWPESPLTPWEAAAVRLEPLSRPGEVVRPQKPPGPVRRLDLSLRPGESYRLHLPGKVVTLEAPLFPFSGGISLYPGLETLTVVHPSLGRPSSVLVLDSRTGQPIAPSPEGSIPDGAIRYWRFVGLAEHQPIVILLLDGNGPASRTVLHRLAWKMVGRHELTNSMEVWLNTLHSIEERRFDFAASLRRYSTLVTSTGRAKPNQLAGPDDIVLDGRDFALPRAVLKLEELARGKDPELRRGAIGALAAVRPMEYRKLFKEFRLAVTEEADWIYAVDALGRAGDPLTRKELLDRLMGPVSLDTRWVQVYARLVPHEMFKLMRDPGMGASRLSPQGRALLDQVAAYLGGPVAGEHLARLPKDRLLGGGRLSLILALRLIGTPAALERLDSLAREMAAAP